MANEEGALRVCAGVDVMADRIEVAVWAFWSNGKALPLVSVSLPAQLGDFTPPWAALLTLLQAHWYVEGFGGVPVSVAALDAGGIFPADVLLFVHRHASAAGPELVPIKCFAGSSHNGVRVVQCEAQEAGRVLPGLVNVHCIGVGERMRGVSRESFGADASLYANIANDLA